MTGNEVKIKGRVYNYKLFHTSKGNTIVNFGLQFYNGKDQQGYSKYSFVDCKGFNDYQLKDKQDVVVLGHLASEDWQDKQGNKKSKLCIVVDNVEYKEEKKEETFIEDSIPF